MIVHSSASPRSLMNKVRPSAVQTKFQSNLSIPIISENSPQQVVPTRVLKNKLRPRTVQKSSVKQNQQVCQSSQMPPGSFSIPLTPTDQTPVVPSSGVITFTRTPNNYVMQSLPTGELASKEKQLQQQSEVKVQNLQLGGTERTLVDKSSKRFKLCNLQDKINTRRRQTSADPYSSKRKKNTHTVTPNNEPPLSPQQVEQSSETPMVDEKPLRQSRQVMIKTFRDKYQKVKLTKKTFDQSKISVTHRDLQTPEKQQPASPQLARQESRTEERCPSPNEQFKMKLLQGQDCNRDDLYVQQQNIWYNLQKLKKFKQNKEVKKTKQSIQQARIEITFKYGFQLSEQEMFDFIFKSKVSQKCDYSQLECLECLKNKNREFESEIRQIQEANLRNQELSANTTQYQTTQQKPAQDPRQPQQIAQKAATSAGSQKATFFGSMVFGRKMVSPPQQTVPVALEKHMHPAPEPPKLPKPQVTIQMREFEFTAVPGFVQQGSAASSTPQNIISHKKNDHSIAYDGRARRVRLNYQTTSIGGVQTAMQAYTHLQKSIVNETIGKINEVIQLLFKQKAQKHEEQNISMLLLYFNVELPLWVSKGTVTQQLDYTQLRSPTFLQHLNRSLLARLYRVLNHENSDQEPAEILLSYRYNLAQSEQRQQPLDDCFRQRPWWIETDNNFFYKQPAKDGCLDQCTYTVHEDILKEHESESDVDEVQLFINRERQRNSGKVLDIFNQTSSAVASKLQQQGAHFIWTHERQPELHALLLKGQAKQPLIYNRIDASYQLTNKKAFFINMCNYYTRQGLDPFDAAIPLTYHIKSIVDPDFWKFQAYFQDCLDVQKPSAWIIKPGEKSNTSQQKEVVTGTDRIREIIKASHKERRGCTSIIQQYITSPLLIQGRKFSIRAFGMLVSTNGVLKGYVYHDCYLQTSCKPFDLSQQDPVVHFTTESVQRKSEHFGKFENGNKMSIVDFQKYLDQYHGDKSVSFNRDLLTKIQRLITDSFRAVAQNIDPGRAKNSFEIFGYDFMLDSDFKMYLISVKENPNLTLPQQQQQKCPLMQRFIPSLLESSLKIAVDPLYIPACLLAYYQSDQLHYNKLVYNLLQSKIEKCDETARNPFHSNLEHLLKESGPSKHRSLVQVYDQLPNELLKAKEKQSNEGGEENHMQKPVEIIKIPDAASTEQDQYTIPLMEQVKYVLVFDERCDMHSIKQQMHACMNNIQGAAGQRKQHEILQEVQHEEDKLHKK